MTPQSIILLTLFLPNCLTLTTTKSGLLQCEFYDKQCIDEAHEKGETEIPSKCNRIETCKTPDEVCYTAWHAEGKNLTSLIKEGRHHVKRMGCFEAKSCENDLCIHKEAKPRGENTLFCCCTKSMCNAKFKWVPEPVKPEPPVSTKDNKPDKQGKDNILVIILIAIVVLVFIASLAICYCFKRKKAETFEAIPITDQENGRVLSGNFNVNTTLMLNDTPIELHKIVDNQLGRGKYGHVYKGKMRNEWVAVKIFQLQSKQSWEAERTIFDLPMINNHKNVLKCLGVDQRKSNSPDAEFWLVTEYHENGSLHDFLTKNMVTWEQLCTIALNIASGLAFLHDEIQSGGEVKPAITHRDFKSKNVLIKSDLTACIGDFGLAHVFYPGQEKGDTFGQVGTLRYMAPEVLEGAIHFSRDSFLRIDMYACGLVLWELATRCKLGQSLNEEYKLPYEAEANNPSLEVMQELMSKRIRPCLKDSWRLHSGMSLLCDTIEECWDHDADARLSASCVVERIKNCRALVPDSGVGSTTSTLNGDTDNNSSLDDDSTVGSSMNPGDATEMNPLMQNS